MKYRGRKKAPIASHYLNGKIVTLPFDQFVWAKRVLDEVVFVVHNGVFEAASRVLDNGKGILPQSKCWAVALESPHRKEYSCKDKFLPLGPLRDPNSREFLMSNIKDLIQGGAAEAGLDVPNGTEIVLCNPVPYQATLDRIMIGEPAIIKEIRNAVWKGLYFGGFEDDFKAGVNSYKPLVVINACTADLKPIVTDTLKGIQSKVGFAHITCSAHPSAWWRKNPTWVRV